MPPIRVEFKIPFTGFYESDHDKLLDRALESVCQNQNGDLLPGTSDVWEHVKYSALRLEYVQLYLKRFAEWLVDEFDLPAKLCKFEFVTMDSPREYNFATDRLFATAPLALAKHIRKKVGDEALDKTIKVHFTSRSGFHSFYKNSLADWPKNMAEWDHNQLGTVIEALVDTHDKGLPPAYDLMEQDQGNGVFDSMIWAHLDAVGRDIVNRARVESDHAAAFQATRDDFVERHTAERAKWEQDVSAALDQPVTTASEKADLVRTLLGLMSDAVEWAARALAELEDERCRLRAELEGK